MRRPWLLGSALVLTIAGVILARTGIVVTRDGGKYEGEITEKNDQVVVTIHGVETIVNRDNVVSLTYPAEAFNTEFADKLAKLNDKDVAGRIALARWAFDRRQYGKAREALDSAIAIDPNNREAADFQNLISSQIKMEQNKSANPPKNVPVPPPNPTGQDRRLLTANDINIIRQKELQSSDRVSVRFENNVEKRYMTYANLTFNQWSTLTATGKALAILEKGDDSMKPDVKILNDPASIAEYRRAIQPLIVNGFATAGCHGSAKGGGLILYSPADNDQVSYTNFYILAKYSRRVNDPGATGTFGPPERKMIDRGQGIHSILCQYGLPASISELDHPTVQGYDQVFRDTDDLRFKQIVDWMDKSLKTVAPDYGIRYDPPRAQNSPPPATAPTTRPMK